MIIQVTPRGMLNTLFRHRYKFGSIFFLIFGLAVTYCAIATPKFESDAALLVKFIAKQSTIYQSAQLPFMQRQLEDARQQLEKSRAAVQAFKAATGINSLDEERTFLLRQQSDTQENLTQAISKQQEAQGRYQR